MARGKRRLKNGRQMARTSAQRRFNVPAAMPPCRVVRHLAFNALALTTAIAAVLAPAHAVTVGEITVESALGQTLSARVPVALQPGESMGAGCVSVPTTGKADFSQLPNPLVTAPEVSGAGIYDLRITTTQPLYEPMYELQLQLRCPGTALVVRQYVLMLDLPGAARPVPAPLATVAPIAIAPAAVTAQAVPQRAARPRAQVAPGTLIEKGSRYRVQAGDTLSAIAARVSGRAGQSLWATADQIFAANPQAFIRGNPDLIKLGSEIIIPATAAAAPVEAPAANATPQPAPAPVAAPVTVATEAAPAAAPVAVEPPVTMNAVVAEPPAAIATGDDAPPAVFQDEQATPEAVDSEDATGQPSAMAPGEVAAPAERGAPTWLATLVGVLIGAAASLALLRDRLLAALRALIPARKAVIAPLAREPAAAPKPLLTRPPVARESTMVVEERHYEAPDDSATFTDPTDAAPVLATAPQHLSNPALDSDLSRLFGESATGDLTANADALPAMGDLDLDLSAATPDGPVDEELGWIGDDTGLMPTQEMPRAARPDEDTVEHIDLQTLSQRAPDSTEISQTLRDALNLLESDYEDELTASQVIDQHKLKAMLDKDASGDEDTLVRTGTDQFPRR